MNYNRFLENSQRSDVIGYNIYSMGREEISGKRSSSPQKKWDVPAFGLPGEAAIGHHLNQKNILKVSVSMGEKMLHFSVVRNHWTPAWMETWYRSEPEREYYPVSGSLAVKETKCFLEDDTFLSEMVLMNDRRQDCEVTISLILPFEKKTETLYRVHEPVSIGCLKRDYVLDGWIAAGTDLPKGKSTFVIPAQGSVTLRYAMAFEKESAVKAQKRLERAYEKKQPFAGEEKRFNVWMEKNAPVLNTGNTDILKVYYYRFFVIYRAVHSPAAVISGHEFEGESVYESPFGGWYGGPVGLPFPLQLEEMKWMRSPKTVKTQVKHWCEDRGILQGYIQATPMAIWHLYLQHLDKEILREAYEPCKKYVFLKYDKEKPDQLPVMEGSWGTGAEYQPSFYQYTTPAWDWRHDVEGQAWGFEFTSLNRVDESVMLAANLKACRNMAQMLGLAEDAEMFQGCLDKVIEKICRLCWDEEKQFFFDYSPYAGKKCDEAPSYDGFLPAMWELTGEEYYGMFAHLMEGGQFDCSFPVPSAGKECPMYWFDNCLTGPTWASEKEPHYYGCSWNGPTWPFEVSLVLEALGCAAGKQKELENLWLHIFDRYTEMHFEKGDRSLPSIGEHYRPTDGMCFSILSEYFHSEWISLFMEYWAGIKVEKNRIVFEPMTRESFSLESVVIRGENYRFWQRYEDGIRKYSYEKEGSVYDE